MTKRKNLPRDTIDEHRHSNTEKSECEVGNPSARAKELEKAEVVQVGGGKGHLKEITVQHFASQHAFSIREPDRLIPSCPDGQIGKNKKTQVKERGSCNGSGYSEPTASSATQGVLRASDMRGPYVCHVCPVSAAERNSSHPPKGFYANIGLIDMEFFDTSAGNRV